MRTALRLTGLELGREYTRAAARSVDQGRVPDAIEVKAAKAD